MKYIISFTYAEAFLINILLMYLESSCMNSRRLAWRLSSRYHILPTTAWMIINHFKRKCSKMKVQ